MNKCHVPITWVNDQAPALNATNLNQYDGELDTLDDRIITLDANKLDKNRFTDSATIDFDTSGDNATAFIKQHSITDDYMQNEYLTDCQTARTQAQTAATNSNTYQLQSEGYGVGSQGGTPVTSGSPYFENNSKYFYEQAADVLTTLLAAFGVSVVGTKLVFSPEFENHFSIAVVGTQLQISNLP